jgi:hypothetical protein
MIRRKPERHKGHKEDKNLCALSAFGVLAG